MSLLKPSVKMPSGVDRGQNIDKSDERVNAMTPPARRMPAGLIWKKNLSLVLALNSVRKSETDTFK
jgi:hypothetical protein